ncbi:EF-hand [Hesseltinella vesiculosa]|uniref:EF-hand n=1 Tax=Hesseltinella vesiculosa TaxID=101127 RepID=A0A1X2GAU1_9FUNG|nr:EF-hand [Hesseltinella vesiculosa]
MDGSLFYFIFYFEQTVKKCVPSVSSSDEVFLKRLYCSFDVDDNNAIDFEQFVDGLSVFMKGTPEEKLELSFKLYDVKHTGYLTRPDLERVMIQLAGFGSDEDKTNEIKLMVNRLFEDLDVDDDGRLSFEEYKLSAMKEPLVVDFLEQFLAEHHLTQNTRSPSRPESVSSYRSGLSSTHPGPTKLSNTVSSSPFQSSSRLSIRVSQAELLEYGHHTAMSSSSGSNPNSPTTATSTSSGQPPHPWSNGTSPYSPPRSPRHLSRPTSMTSLDAALSTMDLNHTNGLHDGKPTLSPKAFSPIKPDDEKPPVLSEAAT